jgi:hypothetical protein
MGSRERPDAEFWSFDEGHGRQGALRAFGRGVASVVLGGLSSMEIVALALSFIGIMAFLWMAGVVAPERLVTEASLSGTWAVTVLAVIRPITWVPYWLVFLGLRAMADAMAPRRSTLLRNAAANLGTLAVLAATAWLMFAAFPGWSTGALSLLGFLTGGVPLEDLGNVPGHWDAPRVAAAVGGVLLLRILLPPLGRDLDLSVEPILGFVSGARGRLDRIALVIAAVGSVILVSVGLALRSVRG